MILNLAQKREVEEMAAIEEPNFAVIRSLLLSKFELLQQLRDPISRKSAR
jgi:hypothetical protein